MSDTNHKAGYKTYAVTWLTLLALTLVMIGLCEGSITKMLVVPLVLTGMTLKAGLISANFMHLRFERAALVTTVVISTIFIAAALYLLIAVDARSILTLAPR